MLNVFEIRPQFYLNRFSPVFPNSQAGTPCLHYFATTQASQLRGQIPVDSRSIKAIQAYSSLFKPIQGRKIMRPFKQTGRWNSFRISDFGLPSDFADSDFGFLMIYPAKSGHRNSKPDPKGHTGRLSGLWRGKTG
jgi:hypothetical protein